MGVKVKTKKNNFPKMQTAVEGLNGRRVSVGVSGEQAWLAGIHEYGCHIKVTPKMRAYLHHQGLHLKASTTEIVIPERAFLRTGFDQGEAEILGLIDSLIGDAAGGDLNGKEFLKITGLSLASLIKDYARDLREPANHPYTIAQKGSGNPLVDTGDMIGAIGYKVE